MLNHKNVKSAYSDGRKAFNPEIPASQCHHYPTKDESEAFMRGWEDAKTAYISKLITVTKELSGFFTLLSSNCQWKSFDYCKPSKAPCEINNCALYKAFQLFSAIKK